MATKKRGKVDNLKPVKTTEEAKKRGRNGGLKTQQALRERRKAKECMNMILSLEVTGDKQKALMKKLGIEDKEQQNIMLLMTSMFMKAASSGDANAIQKILEIAGDLDNQSEQQTPNINIKVLPATIDDIDTD